jgi:hypothetical protein
VAVRALAPAIAERFAGIVSLVAKVLLLVAAVVLIATVWRSVWDATGKGGILAVVFLVAAGLAVGHLLGGPKREESVVLGLSTACRHPAIAFTIASANYPEQRFGGAIILYLLVGALSASRTSNGTGGTIRSEGPRRATMNGAGRPANCQEIVWSLIEVATNAVACEGLKIATLAPAKGRTPEDVADVGSERFDFLVTNAGALAEYASVPSNTR